MQFYDADHASSRSEVDSDQCRLGIDDDDQRRLGIVDDGIDGQCIGCKCNQ